MRTHFSRSAFIEGARDMLPMTVGLIPFGIVCGVGAIAAGASPVAALAMSMIVFSGAAQIIAAQLLAAGAPFAVIVLSCFVISLRFLMYSAALAPYLKPVDHRWRNLVAFLLTDQAFASSIRRFRESSDIRANVSYFVGGGAVLWLAWQIATIAGILAGAVIPAWFSTIQHPARRGRISFWLSSLACCEAAPSPIARGASQVPARGRARARVSGSASKAHGRRSGRGLPL